MNAPNKKTMYSEVSITVQDYILCTDSMIEVYSKNYKISVIIKLVLWLHWDKTGVCQSNG